MSNLFMKDGKVIKWTDACDNAFKELKTLLSSVGVLKYLEFNKPLRSAY